MADGKSVIQYYTPSNARPGRRISVEAFYLVGVVVGSIACSLNAIVAINQLWATSGFRTATFDIQRDWLIATFLAFALVFVCMFGMIPMLDLMRKHRLRDTAPTVARRRIPRPGERAIDWLIAGILAPTILTVTAGGLLLAAQRWPAGARLLPPWVSLAAIAVEIFAVPTFVGMTFNIRPPQSTGGPPAAPLRGDDLSDFGRHGRNNPSIDFKSNTVAASLFAFFGSG